MSGGLLAKYQVRAMDVSNVSAVAFADVTDTSIRSHNLTGVQPYTTYNVSIRAFTSGGYGASDFLQLTTSEAGRDLPKVFTNFFFYPSFSSICIL